MPVVDHGTHGSQDLRVSLRSTQISPLMTTGLTDAQLGPHRHPGTVCRSTQCFQAALSADQTVFCLVRYCPIRKLTSPSFGDRLLIRKCSPFSQAAKHPERPEIHLPALARPCLRLASAPTTRATGPKAPQESARRGERGGALALFMSSPANGSSRLSAPEGETDQGKCKCIAKAST